MEKIRFHYLLPLSILKDRNHLKHFLMGEARKERRPISSLDYIFCSDDYLLNINKLHCNHDEFTDILTFDFEPSAPRIIGEVYISIDRIRDNARELGQTVNSELHRVIFHGLLHLCGYKDKLKPDQTQMRMKENQYLQRYFAK